MSHNCFFTVCLNFNPNKACALQLVSMSFDSLLGLEFHFVPFYLLVGGNRCLSFGILLQLDFADCCPVAQSVLLADKLLVRSRVLIRFKFDFAFGKIMSIGGVEF